MTKLIIKKDDKLVRKMSIHADVLAFTIGSEDGNDIVIQDLSVSLFHVQFEKEDNDYYVRDLQSEWGTFVNGRKITGRTQIRNHDEIDIGNHHITLLGIEEEAKAQSPGDSEYELKEMPANRQDVTSSFAASMTPDSPVQKDKHLQTEPDLVLNGSGNGNGDYPVDLLENAHGEFPYGSQVSNGNGEALSFTESSFSIETENYLQNPGSLTSDASMDGKETADAANPDTGDHYLLGIHGYYYGRKFPVKKPETRIGRNAKLNDIVIRKNSDGKTDQSVSRRQATITFENGCYYLTDKRSKSRCLVNRLQLDVEDKVILNPGDEIEIVSDRQNHIFRMVKENDWDFSFPRKAGAWHIRFRTAMLNAYAAIFLLLFFVLLGRGIVAHQKASDRPDPLTVEESTWHEDAGQIESAPPAGAAYAGYPALADVNRDDIVDLVYIDKAGILRCINGDSKEILWEALDFEADASIPITIADLNKDGRLDVIVVTRDMRVRAIDAVWGIENWHSPILSGPFIGAPVVGDFDNDGLDDVAVASQASAIHIGYSNVRNADWITLNTPEPVRSISASDLTGEGDWQFLVGTGSGKVLFIDGSTREVLRYLDVNEELSKADGNYFNDEISHPIAVADLNGDSVKDLIVYTAQNNLIAFDGLSFQRLWFSTGRGNSHSSVAPDQRMVLGDLDGDALPDVLTLTPQGGLRALKGTGDSQGRVFELWVKPQSDAYFVGQPVLADFNNNGTLDVLAYTDTGTIHIFEGSTGETLWQGDLNLPMLSGAPVIGDLDHDSQMDIAFLTTEGAIHKLQTNRYVAKDAITWGQPFNRSSISRDESPGSINYAYASPVIIFSFSIISLHLISGMRRKRLSQLYIT